MFTVHHFLLSSIGNEKASSLLRKEFNNSRTKSATKTFITEVGNVFSVKRQIVITGSVLQYCK
jgi:hypothetical protein